MKEHAKKALKHDVEFLGKTVPTIAVVALFLIGSGSAAVLTNFGTVTGEASVDQSIQVNGQNGQLDSTATLDTYDAGSYFMTNLDSDGDSTMTITSQTDSAVPVNLETAYEKGDVDDPSNAAVDGVTAHNIVYNPPQESDYDVVVGTDSELEEAIDNSTERILVESGTYTLSGGTVKTGADTTVLASAEGPEDTTIKFDGSSIEAGADDSLTVRGFTFEGTGSNGAITHTEGSKDADVEGALTVEDNIFDTLFSNRDVESDETATVTIEDNFFTGSSDAGVEFGSSDGGELSLTVESNTFAGLADKGLALRVKDEGTNTISIQNNNFVSNSNAAIQTGWSEAGEYTHASFSAEDNYFNHTGELVEDNTGTGLSSDDLSPADNPQTDGEVTVPAGETVEVTQLTYLDVALSGVNSYSLQTSVNPAR
jgi:hypothetical protein